MTYSVKQAAEATGKTKPTILRAIQKGKISAQKDEHGEWEIDPAELHRVYDPVPERTDSRTDANGAAASREIELLREMLADKDRQIESLTRRLENVDDERRTTLRQLTALLTDQRAKTSDVIVTPPPTPAAIITPPPAADPVPAVVKQVPPNETSWLRRMMGGK
jgi:excisionase family DNA binding protein